MALSTARILRTADRTMHSMAQMPVEIGENGEMKSGTKLLEIMSGITPFGKSINFDTLWVSRFLTEK